VVGAARIQSARGWEVIVPTPEALHCVEGAYFFDSSGVFFSRKSWANVAIEPQDPCIPKENFLQHIHINIVLADSACLRRVGEIWGRSHFWSASGTCYPLGGGSHNLRHSGVYGSTKRERACEIRDRNGDL
tara:strand:+ start:408 stop:800 length:393 start_codon:yes stop_codon:yes gene_type:complete